MSDAAKSCPFCSGTVTNRTLLQVYDRWSSWAAFVECVNCGARGPVVVLSSPSDASRIALSSWNAVHGEG